MPDSNDMRKQIIAELKESASLVKRLKEEHRKRRPIVIEFSGSPKAGKTSCINSLKQFLKRNGFEVEVIQERASVCPVDDKHSPMFNIWTACTSIAAMIGILENKKSTCDVVILDRGIFDSLCWFEWLEKQGKMDDSFRKIICDLLLRNEFVSKIDIVFSFTVEPEISIKREFAALLTDELGTIMNETVLQEYLEAIEQVKGKYAKYFNSVHSINTSQGDQDNTSKEVTEKTLETLKELFIEQIGYIKMDDGLTDIFAENSVGNIYMIENYLSNIEFGSREKVEREETYLQPIPIAVLFDRGRNKVLVVKKNSKSLGVSSPEKDRQLLYVGGHTRKEDMPKGQKADFLEVYRKTLQREVTEEIGISVALENIEPIYIYAPDEGERSKKHLAICFLIETDSSVLKLCLDSHELIQNRGTSKSGKFINVNEFASKQNELEEWSQKILENVFEVEIEKDTQVSLFDE